MLSDLSRESRAAAGAEGIVDPVCAQRANVPEPYSTGLEAGALAGKVSGAGGGGFVIFFSGPYAKTGGGASFTASRRHGIPDCPNLLIW